MIPARKGGGLLDMKRCPRCYETYDKSEKFCELDGEPLLAEPTLLVPAAASTVGSCVTLTEC